MKISKEELDAYIQRIHAPSCPLCGNNKWDINEHIFQIIEYDPECIRVAGITYPIVPITCLNCGNVYFINALVAGFIKIPENQSENSSLDNK